MSFILLEGLVLKVRYNLGTDVIMENWSSASHLLFEI